MVNDPTRAIEAGLVAGLSVAEVAPESGSA